MDEQWTDQKGGRPKLACGPAPHDIPLVTVGHTNSCDYLRGFGSLHSSIVQLEKRNAVNVNHPQSERIRTPFISKAHAHGGEHLW